MKILITNDDGLNAKGISALAKAALQFGTVKLVAPDRQRSACGHSMTMADPLRIEKFDFDGIEAYSVSGVPVDCVNVGLSIAFPGGCDLILSGFNHGPNLGFDVTYSGTVGGAMEGTIGGIRSIALSMATMQKETDHLFETGEAWLIENWEWLTTLSLPPRTFLNVNVPSIPSSEIRGHKFVKMGGRVYNEQIEVREDPWGKQYFWQGGTVIVPHAEPESDLEAVKAGYVSITPVSLDWTSYSALETLNRNA